jgi:hypothetical protein
MARVDWRSYPRGKNQSGFNPVEAGFQFLFKLAAPMLSQLYGERFGPVEHAP